MLPREERVEEEEYDRDGFDEEDEHELVVNNRRYGGRFRRVRNREDETATFGGSTRRNCNTLFIKTIYINYF